MSDDYFTYFDAARRLVDAQTNGEDGQQQRETLIRLAKESDSAMVRVLSRLILGRPVGFVDYIGH